MVLRNLGGDNSGGSSSTDTVSLAAFPCHPQGLSPSIKVKATAPPLSAKGDHVIWDVSGNGAAFFGKHTASGRLGALTD